MEKSDISKIPLSQRITPDAPFLTTKEREAFKSGIEKTIDVLSEGTEDDDSNLLLLRLEVTHLVTDYRLVRFVSLLNEIVSESAKEGDKIE